MNALRMILVLTPIAAVAAMTPTIGGPDPGHDALVLASADGRFTLEGDVSAIDAVDFAGDSYALAGELAPIEVESIAAADRLTMSSSTTERAAGSLFVDGLFDPAADGVAFHWPGDVIFGPKSIVVLVCDESSAMDPRRPVGDARTDAIPGASVFIEGAAYLGGLAVVRFEPNVELFAGARFALLRARAVVGEFDAIDMSSLPPGLTARVEFGADDVMVTIAAIEAE